MDQVDPRTVVDVIQIDGFPQKVQAIHSAVISSVILESPAALKITIPKLEKAELLKENFGIINDIVEMFGYKKGCRYVRNASVMAPVVRAYKNYSGNPIKTKMIKRFVGILTGTVLNIGPEETAAYKLREWLLTNLGSGKTRPLKRVIYRKTEKALWLYLQKENCDSLTETRRECFPIEVTKNTSGYFDNTRVLVKKQGGKRLSQNTKAPKIAKIKVLA